MNSWIEGLEEGRMGCLFEGGLNFFLDEGNV